MERPSQEKISTLWKTLSVIWACLALVYDISPIDISPDAIPFLGWIDDIGVTAPALFNLVQNFLQDPNSYVAKFFKILKWIAVFFCICIFVMVGGISLIVITLASGKNIFETFPLTQILWTFVALLGLLVLLGYIFQNKIVGYIGERHTASIIRSASRGIIFRDVYVDGSHGVQQIDLLAVTHKGILVVEKKTWIGLVVGGAYDKQWRVFVNRGKQKYSKKNPHHQNYGHVQALAKNLPKWKNQIISLVIFGNNAKLGNNIPENTINDRDFRKYYRNLPTILEQRDIECIAQFIENLNEQKKELKKRHQKKIKGMRRGKSKNFLF